MAAWPENEAGGEPGSQPFFALSDDDSVAYLHHPFAAIGHGRHIAYGAMQILQGLDLPLEAKCRAALEAAERFDATVRGPFLLIGD